MVRLNTFGDKFSRSAFLRTSLSFGIHHGIFGWNWFRNWDLRHVSVFSGAADGFGIETLIFGCRIGFETVAQFLGGAGGFEIVARIFFVTSGGGSSD